MGWGFSRSLRCPGGKCGHYTKTAIYVLYFGPWAWNLHHEQINYVSFSFLQLHESSYV